MYSIRACSSHANTVSFGHAMTGRARRPFISGYRDELEGYGLDVCISLGTAPVHIERRISL